MEPVRTCVGCRVRAPRSDLLRCVVRDQTVVADASASLPGRGAWVHGTHDCIEAATSRRAWARAFRNAGPLDVAGLLTLYGSTGSSREQADRHMDN
ncbi:YlxR family protein [Microcella sp.]|uniref:YlxR family protein n=1 Tax=Microcella sp. TaxID=1913979 RepID=UPI00391C3500